MGALTTGLLAATMVGSTVAQAQQAKRSAKLQQEAMQQAERSAQRDATMRDIALNAANRKRPRSFDTLLANASATAGASSNMLTGSGGVVDPLPLGRQTLLGS